MVLKNDTLFLASGAVGFLLSLLYYPIIERYMGINHTSLIGDAVERGWLILRRRSDNALIGRDQIRREASWRIATAIWHGRLKISPTLEGASPRTDAFMDVLHGLGASAAGSLLALISWLYFFHFFEKQFPERGYYVIPIVVILISFLNYIRLKKHAESIINLILADELKRGRPIEIFLAHNDL